MAAEGYPGDYGKGDEIAGLDKAAKLMTCSSSMPVPQCVTTSA
jgi:phosphoribosylamine-glycine ligase